MWLLCNVPSLKSIRDRCGRYHGKLSIVRCNIIRRPVSYFNTFFSYFRDPRVVRKK